jgi:hypothetical protein
MERTQNIGPRYAIRLADLHNWHVVTATCLFCRRRAMVKRRALDKAAELAAA